MVQRFHTQLFQAGKSCFQLFHFHILYSKTNLSLFFLPADQALCTFKELFHNLKGSV